jgi:hypothetical protein
LEIRISEMFEHTSVHTDTIQLKEHSDVDKDRIRQLVMCKIASQHTATNKPPTQTKIISVRVALVAAAIVAMLMSALVVNAASGGKLFGVMLLNKENRHIAKEPKFASMEVAPTGTGNVTYVKPLLVNNIINENQLQAINAGSITNIAVNKSNGKYAIPELLTDNGDLVIFTKANKSGWHLKAGEQLTISYTLDLKTREQSDKVGEIMEIGYIKNGELITGVAKKQKDFSFSITAEETGEYYFYAENYSASYIIISSGIIK